LPALSTATHNDREGHETALRLEPGSIEAAVQARGPPAGSVEVTAFPALSTATHNVCDGHDTADSVLLPSTLVAVHARDPLRGRVETITFPAPPAATHSDADGHDNPEIRAVVMLVGGPHENESANADSI
jgi:hypothetical protein